MRTCLPTTVHCDHLIVAEKESEQDLERALVDNKEVHLKKFLIYLLLLSFEFLILKI